MANNNNRTITASPPPSMDATSVAPTTTMNTKSQSSSPSVSVVVITSPLLPQMTLKEKIARAVSYVADDVVAAAWRRRRPWWYSDENAFFSFPRETTSFSSLRVDDVVTIAGRNILYFSTNYVMLLCLVALFLFLFVSPIVAVGCLAATCFVAVVWLRIVRRGETFSISSVALTANQWYLVTVVLLLVLVVGVRNVMGHGLVAAGIYFVCLLCVGAHAATYRLRQETGEWKERHKQTTTFDDDDAAGESRNNKHVVHSQNEFDS
eukprot:PhM_4_TR4944/c0_g1_i1/m.30640